MKNQDLSKGSTGQEPPDGSGGGDAAAASEFTPGVLKGKVGDGPDFLEPMDDDELALWEGG